MTARRLVALVAVGAAVLSVLLLRRGPSPVDLQVQGPQPTTAAALVREADLVVVGRVAAVQQGRVLGDGADGTSVRTQLAELLVDQVVLGSAGDRLVVEEVAALGDGTPATFGGLRASAVGDAGLWLLVRGGDELGATAPVGPHGRFLLDADGTGLVPPVDDALARRLARLGPAGLRDRLRAAAVERDRVVELPG